MRNAMKTMRKACFFVFVLLAPALAQNWMQKDPSPAVTGPAYALSFGYSKLSMEIPGARHVSLNGLDLSGHLDFNSRWGAVLDTSYARTHNIPGTPHAGYALTSNIGPVFYPIEFGGTRVFVHALGGAALVDGAVPQSKTDYYQGWLGRPSYALGGGVEQSVSGPFAVRVSGDYLRTSFFNATGAVHPQNNLRLTASIVFRVRQHRSGTKLR